MDVRLKALSGIAVQWTGDNTAELKQAAGDRFRGVRDDGCALILTGEGSEEPMRPGWWMVRWDGQLPIVSCEYAFGVQCEPVSP